MQETKRQHEIKRRITIMTRDSVGEPPLSGQWQDRHKWFRHVYRNRVLMDFGNFRKKSVNIGSLNKFLDALRKVPCAFRQRSS